MQKGLGASALGTSVYIIDAAAEIIALAFRVPKTGNVQGIEAMIGAVGNTLDGGTRFSLQNLSAGIPDGTPDQSITSAPNTPAGAGWYNPGNFGSVRAVTRGEELAMVIDNPSFTAGDSLTVSNLLYAVSGYAGFPYGVSAAGKQLQSVPSMALRYDDGSYGYLGPECWALSSIGNFTLNTGTTPDEAGLAFTPNLASRLGAVMFTGTVAAGADWDIVVYDSGGSVLATQSCDDANTASTGTLFHSHTLDAPVDLTAGSLYRVVLKPTTANSMTLAYGVFNSLGLMDTADGGQAYYATGRADAGAWTNYNNGSDGYRRPRMFLRFEGFDTAGGGGLIVHPSMGGGMRG